MDTPTKITLEDLGYNEFINSAWKALDFPNASVARVISEFKGGYKVKDSQGEYLAQITGKQRFEAIRRADYPAVGDWVVITKIDNEKAVIQHTLPRQTILQKKYINKKDAQIIATNIDVAFIVESLDKDYSLNRFERYLVLTNDGGIKPAIVLNKIDLVSEEKLKQIIEEIQKRFADITILATSSITEKGINELLAYIEKGKTYCFIGSSGVGKSSLINKLLNRNTIKTNEISDASGKGRHTTTTREIYLLENRGILIDNPGTREVGMIEAESGIESVFDEITSLSRNCKYADCTHMHEPGCAIRQAVEEGKLDEGKYENYLKLKKENEFYEMTELEKRQRDRKFGKFFKKTLEQKENS